MLGAHSGQWYRHDGTQWHMASLPADNGAQARIDPAVAPLQSYVPTELPVAAQPAAANLHAHTANAAFLAICGSVLIARYTLPMYAQAQAHFYGWVIALLAPALCGVAGLLARTPARTVSSPPWLAIAFVFVAVALASNPWNFGGNDVEMIPLAMAAWFAMHGLAGRADVGVVVLAASMAVVAVQFVSGINRDLWMAWIGGGCLIWAAVQFPR